MLRAYIELSISKFAPVLDANNLFGFTVPRLSMSASSKD